MVTILEQDTRTFEPGLAGQVALREKPGASLDRLMLATIKKKQYSFS